MDVLVCGAQVPFMAGGAELHMANLVSALRACGHRTDLIRIPTAWDKVRLFECALTWRLAPMKADVVIATNFPSYFASHPNKVVWLFHQHRGFYDAADAPWSDIALDDDSLEAQRLLTEWDAVALREARQLFTTSATVAGRLADYNGLIGTPLYHPPPMHHRWRSGPFEDYVYSVTRLERNKRPDLVAAAAAHVRSKVGVIVAGVGSMRDELHEMSLGRLELPGHVPDNDLIERFSRALGIVYVPHDEDYGYVTLQAFLAAKPVITTADSGGVLEWVEDGVTGFVVAPTPEAVADAIDRLAGDRGAARRMGENGHRRAARLTWQAVVERLLAPNT